MTDDATQQEQQYAEIIVGGRPIYVDATATPEGVKKAIEHYRTTHDFYKSIDKDYRVGASVRAIVGSAATDEDKLATLKQYYPDAAPYKEGEFVFTTESGKMGLYNPKGFDSGDIASVSREIFTGITSTAGAIVGGGTTFGAGTVAGAAGGHYAGASVFDYIMEQVGTVDTRSTGQRVLARLGESAIAGVGQKVGEVAQPVLSKGVKHILGGGTARSRAIFDRLQRFGITPTAGTVTEGRGAGRVGAALEANFASATRMKNQIESVLETSRIAAEKVATKIGRPQTQQGAGVTVQRGIERATERFVQKQTAMENALSKTIEDRGGLVVQVDEVSALLDDLTMAQKGAPKTLQNIYGKTIVELKSIIDDSAQTGGITYDAFREIKTLFGKRMSDMTEGSISRTMSKRVYAALSESLETSIKNLDEGLETQYRETIALTREFKQLNDDLFRKLADYDAPEKAYRYLINSSKDGGTMLQRLRDQFTDDEWKDVAATVAQKMGYKGFGNEGTEFFQFTTFINNYKSLSTEAKSAIFDKGLRNDLDELQAVFVAMNDNAGLRNASNTAGTIFQLEYMSRMGQDVTEALLNVATGQPAAGNIKRLVTTTSGAVLLPKAVARLMTNRDFVRWLATPVTNKGEIGAHMGRLAAVSKANPEIRGDISSYLQQFSQDENEVEQ